MHLQPTLYIRNGIFMSTYSKYTEIDGLNKAETSDAVLMDDGDDDELWIPKSQMNDWPEKGSTGEFIISIRFAAKKGLV